MPRCGKTVFLIPSNTSRLVLSYSIDLDLAWQTATRDLSELRYGLHAILDELG